MTRGKGASEEMVGRNFTIWALHQSGVRKADIGRAFGIGPQRIAHVIKRFERKIARRITDPWHDIDINKPPTWMARLEAAGAIPRHPGATIEERWKDAMQRRLTDRQRAVRLVRDVVRSFKPKPFEPPQWRLVVPGADDDGRTITRQYYATRPLSQNSPTSGPWHEQHVENLWHDFLLGWWLVGELHIRITNAADFTIEFGARTCRDEGQRLIDRAEFFERELERRKRK